MSQFGEPLSQVTFFYLTNFTIGTGDGTKSQNLDQFLSNTSANVMTMYALIACMN